jgi:hypothetical protein
VRISTHFDSYHVLQYSVIWIFIRYVAPPRLTAYQKRALVGAPGLLTDPDDLEGKQAISDEIDASLGIQPSPSDAGDVDPTDEFFG